MPVRGEMHNDVKRLLIVLQIWLPPTPPSEDSEEYYVDTVLDMKYNITSVIAPAVLASIAPFR